MASVADEPSLSVEEIRVAAIHGQLPALADRLARDRSWPSLMTLFEQAPALPLSLLELTETVRQTSAALRALPPGRRARAAAEETRAIRILAAEALLRRVPRPPLTEPDRQALKVGAATLADAGDLQRAGTTFEEALDWGAAAEVWGRLGELDQMEECLAREDGRHRRERAAIAAVRDAEALIAAGERVAALRLAEGIPEGSAESAAGRALARSLAARLVRGRGVVLRTGDGAPLRFAAAPAVLGRDPLGEVPLRDPGVSRRHALVALVGSEPSLADAGSRAGTFVGGARLTAALPLRGRNQVTLGPHCQLEIDAPASGGRVVLRGLAGLDRTLLAVVGVGPLPLSDLVPGAEGAWIDVDGAGARFGHVPELPVRVGGHFVSPQVDLLHGDVLEIGTAGLRLEVE